MPNIDRNITMTIGISGFEHFLPETEIGNEQLVAHFGMDISPSWIADKTGIKKRHFVGKDENNSDLADKASQMAIRDAGLLVSDIAGLRAAADFMCRTRKAWAQRCICF